MPCIVEGCPEEPHEGEAICRPHWKHMPLRLRQVWWQETQYGKRAARPEVAKMVNDHFRMAST